MSYSYSMGDCRGSVEYVHSRFFQFILLVLSLVIVLSPGPSMAGNTVTFALFSREWAPFEMIVDGEPVGAAVELFKALMPPDVETTVELCPSPRSKLREPSGPVFARLESREWVKDAENFLWSEPVTSVKTVMYSSKTNPREYAGDASLYGLTVGCIKGFVYPIAEHLFARGKVVRYDVNDDLILLRMVKAGRVDVAFFDDISIAWMISKSEEMNNSDFHIAGNHLGSEDLRFFFSKHKAWEERLPEINRLIREKRADGTIDAIINRYR